MKSEYLSKSTKQKIKEKTAKSMVKRRGKKILRGTPEDMRSKKSLMEEIKTLEKGFMGRAEALERSRGDKEMPESARQHLRKNMLKIQQKIKKLKSEI